MEKFRKDDKLYFSRQYVKKSLRIHAMQINTDFIVETLEGAMVGKAGDYLIKGVEGELYPCAKSIFEKTYEAVLP